MAARDVTGDDVPATSLRRARGRSSADAHADPAAPLLTPRLLLRPWRDDPDDLDAYSRLSGDAEVMRFIGDGRPLSRIRAGQQLHGFADHWRRHGYGLRAIEERDGGAIVGFAGVVRASQPGVRPGDVEIGWRLTRDRWGRGYATEAAQAVLAHAFETLRLARLVALVRPANAASIHVAEKLGMRFERETRCTLGLPLLVYALANALATDAPTTPGARAPAPDPLAR